MKKTHNQGFSLVELLIAIAILSLIMVALASFMGSTTNVYTTTRNDIELQRTGQEVYDMIADKIMQASEIRIGSNGNEYRNSKDTGASAVASGSGYLVKAFDDFKIDTVDTNVIDYICISYEQKINLSGIHQGKAFSMPYRQIIDVYYFKDNKVYMTRTEGPLRDTSVKAVGSDTFAVSSGGEEVYFNPGESNNVTAKDPGTCILPPSSVDDTNADLVCNNLETIKGYAIAEENAVYLDMDFQKQKTENTAQGMITIRNSYVLFPKPAPVMSGDGSSEAPPEP